MYTQVVVGGTFDGLHAGHRTLLKAAFHHGKTVLIGLTSDRYVRERKHGKARSYAIRHAQLMEWLDHHGWQERARIVSIDDAVGPAGEDPNLEAIVVSEESKPGVSEINARRIANGLSTLRNIRVAMVDAEDKLPISTTRIRKGIINHEGKLLMPDHLREELAQPLGTVLSGTRIRESIIAHKNDSIITVGDRTTKTVLDMGITPRLMIIDHKVNRNAYADLRPLLTDPSYRHVNVTSGPGYISKEAIRLIHSSLRVGRGSTILEIDGEDDLLALPAIVAASQGTLVYYGQPPIPAWACGPVAEGIVQVVVTPEGVEHARQLLRKFVPSA